MVSLTSSLLFFFFILHHPHPHPHPHRSLLIPQQQQQLPLTPKPTTLFQTCRLLPREKVTSQTAPLLSHIKRTLGPFSLLTFIFSFPRHATRTKITTIHDTNHTSLQLNRFPNGHHWRWFRRFIHRLCLLDALRRFRVAHQRLQHKGLRGSSSRSSGCRLCLLDQGPRWHPQGVRSGRHHRHHRRCSPKAR